MKNLPSLILILLLLAGTSFFIVSFYSQENGVNNKDGDEESAAAVTRIIEGDPAVYIEPELQMEAGISIQRLEPATYESRHSARAHIIDLQSMVDIRSRYRQLNTLLKRNLSRLEVSKKEYQRLQLLHEDDGNISTRMLQQAKIDWLADQAEVNTIQHQIESLAETSIQKWGKTITDMIFEEQKLIDQFLLRQSTLILVALLPGQQLSATNSVVIKQPGSETQTLEAEYISEAPVTHASLQGPAYFYQVSTPLRAGTVLEAIITGMESEQKGVVIPESAVIWYSDTPWSYIKGEEDFFIRKEIEAYHVDRDQWFVSEGLKPDEYVVVRGVQMLLSQEFHWSIPDEDDDP